MDLILLTLEKERKQDNLLGVLASIFEVRNICIQFKKYYCFKDDNFSISSSMNR